MEKRGFSELFKDSLNEYGEKFVPVLKTFIFIYFIPLIVFILIGILSTAVILGGVISGNIDSLQRLSGEEVINILSTNMGTGSLVLLISIFVLLTIGFVIFSLLTTLTYIHLSFSKKPNFKESFSKARKDFWRYLGIVLVVTVFLALLFLLFIVPGIIFMVYWVFGVFILINEKKGIMDSLKRSFNLVRGRWWITFGYILLINLIAIIVLQLASLIPLGSLVSQLVIYPIMIFFIKNYYLDVKKSK